jgi:hypothetical protein
VQYLQAPLLDRDSQPSIEHPYKSPATAGIFRCLGSCPHD